MGTLLEKAGDYKKKGFFSESRNHLNTNTFLNSPNTCNTSRCVFLTNISHYVNFGTKPSCFHYKKSMHPNHQKHSFPKRRIMFWNGPAIAQILIQPFIWGDLMIWTELCTGSQVTRFGMLLQGRIGTFLPFTRLRQEIKMMLQESINLRLCKFCFQSQLFVLITFILNM